MSNAFLMPSIDRWRTDMSVKRQFLLPDVGEGLTEAEVIRWHVATGDHVVVNQPLAEIETAKALVELPCPFDGIVVELLATTGVVLPIGTPLVAFEVEVDESQPVEGSGALLVGYGVADEVRSAGRRRRTAVAATSAAAPTGRVLAKPPVRQLATRLGLDLSLIAGSGPGGIVTRDDVQQAVSGNGSRVEPPVVAMPGDVRTPATAVQRAMADAMVRSAFTAPHATVWVDVDVTESMAQLQRMRADRAFEGSRLSPLTLVARALLGAIERNPAINAVWDARTREVVTRGDVNLGIAVASPRGLLVPNIPAAQSLTLPDLARALTELTTTARDGRTPPSAMTGGTITITNVGVFGVDGGTPIINPGESAILAAGRVMQRPWVVDGVVAARDVMQLSLSFDHRVVDGQLGSMVLADVAALLSAAQ